jgi:translation elongation factor EF-1alpha
LCYTLRKIGDIELLLGGIKMGLFDIFKKKEDALGNQIVSDMNMGAQSPNSYTFMGDVELIESASFKMTVEDVFTITGRGTVACGVIEFGEIHMRDDVKIQTHDKVIKTVITGVVKYRKLKDIAQAGDNVGLLLRGIDRNEIQKGDIVYKN